jgi:hypothetical protein
MGLDLGGLSLLKVVLSEDRLSRGPRFSCDQKNIYLIITENLA